LGELWSARAEIAQAIDRAPAVATYRYQWALIELALERPEPAIEALESVLTVNGEHPAARRDLALVRMTLGDREGAADAIEKLESPTQRRVLRQWLQSGRAGPGSRVDTLRRELEGLSP
ncbi:MAG: hypothetical protein AAFQ82_26640, partial [Myxococcota bacterium]